MSNDKTDWKPNFILIAIDTHPSMFVKKENEDGTITHPFKDCLTACYEVADKLIFAKNGCRFGIVFMNDDDKASFVDNDMNLLQAVKLLKKTSNLSNDELEKSYKRQSSLDLAAFFLCCKKKFTRKEDSYKRKLILITSNDNPVKDDANKRFTALNEAKTFLASDINFDLVAFRTNFDYTVFYNEMMSLFSKNAAIETICEDKDGLKELLNKAIFSYVRRRKMLFYPFVGDDSRYITVMQVDFIRTANLYSTARVAPDGRPVRKLFLEEDPEYEEYETEESNFDTFPLSKKDMKSLAENELPMGLNLMYISSRVTDVGMVLSPPSLLQADYQEELKFFEQFWQYCVQNDSVLVCIQKLQRYARIRFVELIPKFVNNNKMFLIKSIPYCTEILIPKISTPLKLVDESSVSEHRKELINELIETLTFDYDASLLPNPKYAKKKAYITAKLLDEPYVEPQDISLNATEVSGLDEIISKIKVTFGLNDGLQGIKRKAAASTSRWKRGK